MNKTEVVKKTLNHQHTPEIPYAINLAGKGYALHGQRLLDAYASEQILQDYHRGMLTFNEAVSLAIGNYMLYVYAPWWRWYNLPAHFAEEDTPEDLPDTRGYGNYEAFFEKVKYIKETYDVYVLVAIWGSHWEKANLARGIQNFLYDLAATVIGLLFGGKLGVVTVLMVLFLGMAVDFVANKVFKRKI